MRNEKIVLERFIPKKCSLPVINLVCSVTRKTTNQKCVHEWFMTLCSAHTSVLVGVDL